MTINDFFELKKEEYFIELNEHINDKKNDLPPQKVFCETNGELGSYCIVYGKSGYFLGDVNSKNVISCWAFFEKIDDAIAAL